MNQVKKRVTSFVKGLKVIEGVDQVQNRMAIWGRPNYQRLICPADPGGFRRLSIICASAEPSPSPAGAKRGSVSVGLGWTSTTKEE